MNQMVTRWFHISVECPNGDEFANLLHKGTTQRLECDLPHCVWHLNIWFTVGNALWEVWFWSGRSSLWMGFEASKTIPSQFSPFFHLWFKMLAIDFLFLPSSLYSAIMDSDSLAPWTQISSFYYKVLCHGILLQQ